MNKGHSKYIKLCDAVLRALRKARTPLRSSKYSNHIYTMHQHCVLLVLREKEHKSYRDFVDWLYECEALCAFIGLQRIPHFTTLQKAAQRIQTTVLNSIISAFISFTHIRKLFLSVDGTGFSLHHVSRGVFKIIRRRT
jgi:hypothetical protein